MKVCPPLDLTNDVVVKRLNHNLRNIRYHRHNDLYNDHWNNSKYKRHNRVHYHYRNQSHHCSNFNLNSYHNTIMTNYGTNYEEKGRDWRT